jgi:hypothetical protein
MTNLKQAWRRNRRNISREIYLSGGSHRKAIGVAKIMAKSRESGGPQQLRRRLSAASMAESAFTIRRNASGENVGKRGGGESGNVVGNRRGAGGVAAGDTAANANLHQSKASRHSGWRRKAVLASRK